MSLVLGVVSGDVPRTAKGEWNARVPKEFLVARRALVVKDMVV